jgi:hypothetical protein
MFGKSIEDKIRNFASTDAALGLDQGDDRCTAILGPVQQFDPLGNTLHGNIADTLGRVPERDEFRARAETLKKAATLILKLPLWVLLAILIGGLAFEMTTGVLTVVAMNVPQPEATMFGILLAILTIAVASRLRAASLPMRIGASILLWILAAAIASVRLVEAGLSVSTRTTSIAAAILFTLMTCGLALFLEQLVQRLQAAYPTLADAWVANRKARVLSRKISEAQQAREAIDLARDEHTKNSCVLSAIYTTSYREASARLRRTNPLAPTASSSTVEQ